MSNRYQGGFITASYNGLKAPDAPTIGTATVASTTSISITFTAPSNVGGSAITSYTAISSPGGFTQTGASSPLVVTGLTTGDSYTFNVIATNSYGSSPLSAASNSAIPAYVYPGTLTTAYFLLDNSAGNINRYVYSDNTVATGTALPFSMGSGAGAGNSIVGIFNKGSASTDAAKYTYASSTAVSTTAMTGTGGGMAGSSAAGNSTKGVFAIGATSGPGGKTQIYTYSSDAIALGGTSASGGGFFGYAAGNSSFGIFANGAGGVSNSERWKYTYSSDTSVSTTSSSANGYYGAACGPSTYGIFAIGQDQTITNKFTYSGETSAVSTSLTANLFAGCAAGGNSVGIFVRANSTTTTNVWTYSGDTVAVGTSLIGGVVGSAAGASNGTTGVNV